MSWMLRGEIRKVSTNNAFLVQGRRTSKQIRFFFTFPNSSTVGFPWFSEALLTERAFHDTRAVIQRTLLMRFFLKSAWRSRQAIERVAKSTVKDRVCSCRVVLGELFFRFLE